MAVGVTGIGKCFINGDQRIPNEWGKRIFLYNDACLTLVASFFSIQCSVVLTDWDE